MNRPAVAGKPAGNPAFAGLLWREGAERVVFFDGSPITERHRPAIALGPDSGASRRVEGKDVAENAAFFGNKRSHGKK